MDSLNASELGWTREGSKRLLAQIDEAFHTFPTDRFASYVDPTCMCVAFPSPSFRYPVVWFWTSFPTLKGIPLALFRSARRKGPSLPSVPPASSRQRRGRPGRGGGVGQWGDPGQFGQTRRETEHVTREGQETDQVRHGPSTKGSQRNVRNWHLLKHKAV
eukprot:scaffold2244_cov363-Pavlova_lutheri.AAC.22